MRPKVYLLLLSFLLSAGSVDVSAFNGNNHRGQHSYEQRHDKKTDKKDKKKDKRKDNKKNWDRRHQALRPMLGPRPVHHAKPVPLLPPRLRDMVRHATRGGKDINVWRVNETTFVVRYRKGHKIYTRYLYPYTNRYGANNVVSVNWMPQAPWIEIAPLQINISL